MDALTEALENLRNRVREVEEQQMQQLLEILNPIFSAYSYDLLLKEGESPIFVVGYEGRYEASVRYKNRVDGTLIEFLYQEGREIPISLSIKKKGLINRKYEKPKTLGELKVAIKNALLN